MQGNRLQPLQTRIHYHNDERERGIDVYLLQETWLPDEYESFSVINRFYMFHHGTDEASDSNEEGDEETPLLQTRKGHTRGGMLAIILSPKATEAWKQAGQHDPIISGNILGCATRFIALSLHFIDHLGEKVKINTCSIYHPTGVSQQKRSEFLSSMDTLYDTLDTDDHIIISGSDINASIGNRKSTFCHQDDTIETHEDNQDNIGPFGIDHVTKPGMEFRIHYSVFRTQKKHHLAKLSEDE
eukprot:scaffold162830_cov52-Attheya_sp.AAC.1